MQAGGSQLDTCKSYAYCKSTLATMQVACLSSQSSAVCWATVRPPNGTAAASTTSWRTAKVAILAWHTLRSHASRQSHASHTHCVCRAGPGRAQPSAGGQRPGHHPVRRCLPPYGHPLLQAHKPCPDCLCGLHSASVLQALDERSLRLVVNDLGIIQSVGASPILLFGINAAQLIGHSAACCVAALRGAGAFAVCAWTCVIL